MAFPSSLPAYVPFSTPITLGNFSHTSRHKQMEDDIYSLATKLGVDGSAVTSTIDYKVASLGTLVASLATDKIARTETNASAYGFVLNESNLISNSATKVPTQASVKTYVDGRTTNVNADKVDGFDASSTPTAGTLLALNSRAQTGEWYEEIARVALGAAGDLISVTSIPAKRYLRILVRGINSGALNGILRFNNDSGNNYAYRVGGNAGAESAVASTSSLPVEIGSYSISATYDIENYQTSEKIVSGFNVAENTVGAANIPGRGTLAGKWSNTSTQITRIDFINLGAGDFAIGSEVVVLGHD